MITTLMFRPHSSWAVVKQHYKNKEKLLWLLCLPLEALETSGLCTTAANPKSWTAFMESLDVEVERLCLTNGSTCFIMMFLMYG